MAELKILNMDEIPATEVGWLWYPYIPYGKPRITAISSIVSSNSSFTPPASILCNSARTAEMDRGARAAGVKRIRIHDLRHSHISLLIDMGFSAVAIADRVGHESIEITYRYAHLFPSKQTEMADRLDDLGKGDF